MFGKAVICTRLWTLLQYHLCAAWHWLGDPSITEPLAIFTASRKKVVGGGAGGFFTELAKSTEQVF